jgi:hypothetical protein
VRLLRRILITGLVTVVAIVAGIYWISPIALSFYAARKAPPIARVVPTDLKDDTVSPASGMRLSYLGYDFEVPWIDLDQSKTEVYPKDKAEKRSAICVFRSGLRLWMKVVPPREFSNLWATDFKTPPQVFEAIFGAGTASSDYIFVNNVYRFTPDKMHYWSLSQAVHTREQMLLVTKSIMAVKAADTGISDLHTQFYSGFQQGNPQTSRDTVVVDLYCGDEHLEILFLQKDYNSPSGVTQPEINRIIQSLHKAIPSQSANSPIAKSN